MDLGFSGLGMPMGARAGTAEGASLEERAWKTLLLVIPWHTHGTGSPDIGISHPELAPGPRSPEMGLSIPGAPAVLPTGTCRGPVTGRGARGLHSRAQQQLGNFHAK